MPDPGPLPDGFRIELDPGVRRPGDGSVLIGGSPIRVIRLTPEGRRLVERLTAGDPVPHAPGAQRLVRRLLDGGLAHPRPPGPAELPRVAVVIPVRDDATGLAATLAALNAEAADPTYCADGAPVRPGAYRVVTVDDCSSDPDAIATAASGRQPPATLIRRRHRGGPAAARNTGWRATEEPIVAFLDANCEPEPGWLHTLLPHFADPEVAAIAPRVAPISAPGTPPLLSAYEQARSPLDLGPKEATVRPRSHVAYLPTAALVVRRKALEAVDGFDEGLRVGEDVDLVWRLAAAGWTVRYEPRATVSHPTRASWASWCRQRYGYGTSAAPLARRHGRAVAPASMSASSGVVWLLVAAGRLRLAATVAGASIIALAVKLRHFPGSAQAAVQLAGIGHLRAGLTMADALRRAWPPAALALGIASRRSRPALMAVLVVPPLIDSTRRATFDVARFTALRLIDDLAYATGVWTGCVRERSAKALAPDITGWMPTRRDQGRRRSMEARAGGSRR